MLTHLARVRKLLAASDRAFALALNNPLVTRDILFAVLVTDSRVLEPEHTELMRNLLQRVRDNLLMEQAQWETNRKTAQLNQALNPRSRLNRGPHRPGGGGSTTPPLSVRPAASWNSSSNSNGGGSEGSSPNSSPSSRTTDDKNSQQGPSETSQATSSAPWESDPDIVRMLTP